MMAAPTVGALALLQLAIGTVIAPRTDQMPSAWWQASASREASKAIDPGTFWLGDEVVGAGPGDPEGPGLGPGVSVPGKPRCGPAGRQWTPDRADQRQSRRLGRWSLDVDRTAI